MRQPAQPPRDALLPARRRLLLGAIGALAGGLSACGGGGSGGGDGAGGGGEVPPPPATDQPGGRLVFTNSSQVATWRFGVGAETVFDLGTVPSLALGASVSPDGLMVLPREIDNFSIALDAVDLAGRDNGRATLPHELAFFTSGVMFDAAGERIAFGLDEYDAVRDDRVTRVLVHRWSDGALLASIDGYDQPEWVAATGELVLRAAGDSSLHRFDRNLAYAGPLGVVALTFNSSFSLSPDGRYVLLEDGPRIRVVDLQGGGDWVAAERISNLHAPRLSPDGRWLACHGIDLQTATPTFHTYVPHVLPFAPGVTVQADETTPTLPTLAFTGYTMTWLP